MEASGTSGVLPGYLAAGTCSAACWGCHAWAPRRCRRAISAQASGVMGRLATRPVAKLAKPPVVPDPRAEEQGQMWVARGLFMKACG